VCWGWFGFLSEGGAGFDVFLYKKFACHGGYGVRKRDEVYPFSANCTIATPCVDSRAW
jgi:hypothetical protein